MADHILDGFSGNDELHGGQRNVTFDSDAAVITVYVRDRDGDSREQHFRLTEVEQRWVEVDRG
ncbi:hypothetical protein [Saccharothrix sp. HUAS TT1]|uniref:hypothetical protein n=1 Tax=unclassified Saccharothrix TaxID=2593673 RepID=UPI00345C162F